MTIDAEAHGVIDDPLRHSHLREIAVTGGTIDTRANVRGMIEPQVRLLDKSIDTLPWHVFTAFRVVAQQLNPRVFGVLMLGMPARGPVFTPVWQS